MGGFSAFHWIVVLLVILILFGAGKLPQVMGDLAKGVKAFKQGMKDDAEAEPTVPRGHGAPGRSAGRPAAGGVKKSRISHRGAVYRGLKARGNAVERF